MIDKGTFPRSLRALFIAICLFLMSDSLWAEDKKLPNECIEKAVRRINDIRSLPDIQYLHTMDGQSVLLNEFYAKCLNLFPQCVLFDKFYYWQNEIREIVSNGENGVIKHKIRSYHNCISTFCPDADESPKTYGDVAEFYDGNGDFMGLSVYVGDGKYCALPYDGYRK